MKASDRTLNTPSTFRRGALERRLMIFCLPLILGGIFLAAKMPAQISAMEKKQRYDSEFYEFADLFSEVYATIRERYVDEVPSKQLFEGAINGMFATLDPHSSYMPPDTQEALTRDTEGEYSGVGLHITQDRDKILTVISPIAGSPSAKAGVLPWDRIIEINGKTTRDLPLMEAVKRLTGPTGSTVKIKVWRKGKIMEFSLKRENIKVESVFTRILDGNIGYLRLSKFQDDSADAVRTALKDFNAKGVRGVIVDLRYNPGGLLDRAVEICNMFLPKGQLIVAIKGRNKGNNREFVGTEEPICKQPLAVLVNYGSASASEIFAGAMKDTGRGVLIGPKGEHTYGKGSVQTISTISKSLERDNNGDMRPSGIRLTTARYYTPKGHAIMPEKGINFDVTVALPEGHELELARHGLLGDPDQMNPDLLPEDMLQSRSKPDGKDKPEETLKEEDRVTTSSATNSEDVKTTRSLVEILKERDLKAEAAAKKAKAQPSKEFHDIVLEEALKRLQTIVISESRKAA